MLGTIVNTTAILIGSTAGSLMRTGIPERYKSILFNALGLACIVLGANAALTNMAHSEYPVLFILSLTIGGIIGEWLNLQGWMDRMTGVVDQDSTHAHNGLQGLMTGFLLYAIGTFSIIGPVLSALSPTQGWDLGEAANTYLYTNATLDLVTSAVLSASYGRIMLWAAPMLFCWQGLFYALAYICGDGMPEPLRVEISIVGGVLILSSGLAILGIKDCKTINLLPSLLVPVIFFSMIALYSHTIQ